MDRLSLSTMLFWSAELDMRIKREGIYLVHMLLSLRGHSFILRAESRLSSCILRTTSRWWSDTAAHNFLSLPGIISITTCIYDVIYLWRWRLSLLSFCCFRCCSSIFCSIMTVSWLNCRSTLFRWTICNGTGIFVLGEFWIARWTFCNNLIEGKHLMSIVIQALQVDYSHTAAIVRLAEFVQFCKKIYRFN